MILQRLTILNYRNIAEACLDFSPGINSLTGANGQGKTNLLDAIYYLSLCKSACGATDANNIRHGEDQFMITGIYEDENQGQEKITVAARRGQRKHLKRNGKEYQRFADHVGIIPLVMISPQDQELITGASEARRRFINAIISQYDAEYLAAVMRYERTIRQRNALLREDATPDATVMAVLEELMDHDAQLIYAARRTFVEEFTPFFQEIYQTLSPDQTEMPAILYSTHGDRGPLAPLLASYRERERIVGHTLHGPHRDDLTLTLRSYPLRHEGSQGQSKTFFIALKLAQYQYLRTKGRQRTPILLLDDIFDKLDTRRVSRIINYVANGMPGQVFITDTDRSHVDRMLSELGEGYSRFHVENGEIQMISDSDQ